MKVPSFDNVKAVAAIVAVGALGYVLYRMYNAGSDIKDAIGETFDKIAAPVKSIAAGVSDTVAGVKAGASGAQDANGTPVYDALGNFQGYESAPAEDPLENESAAETARLMRQNMLIGYYSPSSTDAQLYSPDALS